MRESTGGISLDADPTPTPQNHKGTVYLRIDSEFLKQVGIDTDRPETIPEEIPERFYKGGRLDGKVVIDLEAAAEATRREVSASD